MQVERSRCSDRHGCRIRRDGLAADIERQSQTLRVRRDADKRRRLKVAVVARGFEPGAAELRRDEFGGNVELGRRRAAALERVRRQKRDVRFEIIGRQVRRDLLRRRRLRARQPPRRGMRRARPLQMCRFIACLSITRAFR